MRSARAAGAKPAANPQGATFWQESRSLTQVKPSGTRSKWKSGKNTENREYTLDDYLLLYAVRDTVVSRFAIILSSRSSFARTGSDQRCEIPTSNT
jgi:hypothetical protein